MGFTYHGKDDRKVVIDTSTAVWAMVVSTIVTCGGIVLQEVFALLNWDFGPKFWADAIVGFGLVALVISAILTLWTRERGSVRF
jgi:hypothetical protein